MLLTYFWTGHISFGTCFSMNKLNRIVAISMISATTFAPITLFYILCQHVSSDYAVISQVIVLTVSLSTLKYRTIFDEINRLRIVEVPLVRNWTVCG